MTSILFSGNLMEATNDEVPDLQHFCHYAADQESKTSARAGSEYGASKS